MNNDLTKRIKKLEEEILAYKSTQPIGSDSVRIFANMTNNEWDYQGVIPADWNGALAGSVDIRVRFAPYTQVGPFARCRAFVQVNGQNFNYWHSNAHGSSGRGTSVSIDNDYYAGNSTEVLDPTLVKFIIRVTVPANSSVKIKYVVDATDKGRVYQFMGAL